MRSFSFSRAAAAAAVLALAATLPVPAGVRARHVTRTMRGLQIGLVNVIQEGSDLLPVMPLVHWSF